MYIVKKTDEDLLCEKGDEICNAVHNVIIAVAKKTDFPRNGKVVRKEWFYA